MAGAPETWHQRLLAACLAGGPSTVASHRASARLWDVGPFRRDDRIEVACPQRRSPTIASAHVHRSVDLRPSHRTVVAGIPVTTPARTIVDLGLVAPVFLVRDALEQLLVRRLVTVAEVEAMVEELSKRGRNGIGATRTILSERALGAAVGDSGLESIMASLLADAGLPQPTFQFELLLGGRRRRIDFAYPELRIAIEVDGYEQHTRLEVFQDDRQRGNDLELAGWLVLHFTWAQIVERPGYVTSVVRRALTTRSAA